MVSNIAEERVGVQLACPRLYNKFADEAEARAMGTRRTVATSGQVW